LKHNLFSCYSSFSFFHSLSLYIYISLVILWLLTWCSHFNCATKLNKNWIRKQALLYSIQKAVKKKLWTNFGFVWFSRVYFFELFLQTFVNKLWDIILFAEFSQIIVFFFKINLKMCRLGQSYSIRIIENIFFNIIMKTVNNFSVIED
jgi:hypothetical protein